MSLIAPKKDPHEQAAEVILEHALCNPYLGPPVGGDTYAGWPLPELAKLIPGDFQPQVLVAMAHKINQHGGRASSGSFSFSVGGGGGAGGIASASRPHSLEEMMAMRMRWGAKQANAPWAVGFKHMAMHSAGDVVHIWIVTHDGKSIVLEDEYGLYPSDTLITKIRLLQSGETE